MKVLVTGAGGFLGLATVRALSQRGADVVGLVHRQDIVGDVRAAGGTPVVGDVLDLPTLEAACQGCEGLVHLATSHGEGPDAAEHARKVRVDGARNAVRAARARGVRRLVIGSGYWVYRSHPGVITEDAPVEPRGESRINFDTEQAGLDANAPGALEVVVVRPGMVYGDGSWFGSLCDALRDGTYRLIGEATNRWSFVSREDTGGAFAQVLERGVPGEVYNVVDGHPAPWREFAGYVAGCLQRPPPDSISFDQASLEVGPDVAYHLVANRALSSSKIEALGWRPRYPAYPEGIEALLRAGAGHGSGPRA